ncbi:unnamed protein product [Schistosoma mattheei]|uniref:Uncharacterized protein n=1 Tax=Schistosoma mattheei TaxID=31246 RepID=A0A3P8KDD8_9TREM|nr:unnamed protein product [Schistosoma mattheei]
MIPAIEGGKIKGGIPGGIDGTDNPEDGVIPIKWPGIIAIPVAGDPEPKKGVFPSNPGVPSAPVIAFVCKTQARGSIGRTGS